MDYCLYLYAVAVRNTFFNLNVIEHTHLYGIGAFRTHAYNHLAGIKPNIGNVAVKDMTTHDLDVFYDRLLDQPAVVLKGHKKDTIISQSVIVKIHALMSGAFKRAISWKYIAINPAENVTLPQRVKKSVIHGQPARSNTLWRFVRILF